ncbi:hypothetical protein [Phycicoccus sp. Soil748]|uniref:hypothetical protein n=1 Tax=Phycicoccus sp. Soil748 TaxID=1736397 RepID=UPI000702F82E|nr:hypothetical protein [Phycicoccus sp. Soil748]KRE56434.1 hypothetical protein ASG70_04770 [Phycicoccus sp. Soil748]
MNPLFHFAEPYAPQGNIDARAGARAIGRPQLDMWDMFLRETLQNSWDARLAEGPITYAVDGFWPTEEQVATLRQVVFPRVPRDSSLESFLKASIDDQPLLVVTDSGTKGLGGPTRADKVTDEATDFVDFVRNVGRAAEKQIGGGTYGFGKGVLWQASSCSTVLIYSKSTYRGRRVSRFIAMGHTNSYAKGTQRYTGRHWWGTEHDVTKVEPLEGREADRLAESLGMTRLKDKASGTSLMVLGPLNSDNTETMSDIIGRLASAALWWAWPHAVDGSVAWNFTDESTAVDVPHPDQHPLLKHFAGAYREAGSQASKAEFPWHKDFLRMQRPTMPLGTLVWRNLPPDEIPADGHVDIHSHVALMRQPRLIVKYLQVREAPKGQATVGVFVADAAADSHFASAEPVAHDDWAPTNMGLPKGARNPVKYALERLKETFARAVVTLSPDDESQQRRQGLVHLSTTLGDFVSGAGDAAFDPKPPGGGGGGSRRKLKARIIGQPTLRLEGQEHVATFAVEATVPPSSPLPVTLSALPYVLSEAGREKDADLEQPVVRKWHFDAGLGEHVRRGLRITQSGSHEVTVDVLVPLDSAVGLTVALVPDGEPS